MSEKVWACISGGGCVTAFIAHALPYLQLVAVIVSILAGVKALRKKP